MFGVLVLGILYSDGRTMSSNKKELLKLASYLLNYGHAIPLDEFTKKHEEFNAKYKVAMCDHREWNELSCHCEYCRDCGSILSPCLRHKK